LDQPKDKNTILLAIADAATLKAVFEMLQLEGYRVLGCTNLKCARCIFAAMRPEIAVMDYHLPDGDAGQFLEAAKRTKPHMKCIVLAEAAHFALARSVTGDFADLVMAKPLEETAFRTFVRACRESLRSRRKEPGRARSAGPSGDDQ
jgi:DNA-binding NtrC family response regulator